MKRHKGNDQLHKGNVLLLWIFILMLLTGTACGGSIGTGKSSSSQAGQGATTQEGERVDTGFVVTGPDSFDSADTAVLVEKSTKESTLTFLNLVLGRRYTLSYDGTTHFYDKHGESVSLTQIDKGAIVDVTFLKSKKHLTSLRLSKDAWSYENVDRYEIDPLRGEVSIGSEIYRLSDNTQYLSGGKSIDSMDINTADTLSFYGIDSEILSVKVEKGHGYLRLVNNENFLGGWIEIGQTQVYQITQDMLITVPEGSYPVTISYKGGGGVKNVVINRNEETTLDVGDLQVAEAQFGTVLFSLTPSSANLYIDGTKQDPSQPISLEYGIHQLIARAEGYQTVTKYLRVGQASAGVDITLEKAEDASDEETSKDQAKDGTSTGKDATDKSSTDRDTSNRNTADQNSTDKSSTDQNNADPNTTDKHTTDQHKTDTNAANDATSGAASTNTAGTGADGSGEKTGTEKGTNTDVLTDYYKVYVDAPEGVEVYLNGNYVGISPCSFRKQSGVHVITLRKSGYETRSYTVQVDDESKDMSYSFVDLVKNGAGE